MDQFFVVHGEKIPGKGEDSFLLSVNERAGLAAVFDGCGGSGARVYKDLGGKTGAYIAARVLSDTMCGWFEDSWDEDERVYRISDVSLKKAIDARLSGLRRAPPQTGQVFRIVSSVRRSRTESYSDS